MKIRNGFVSNSSSSSFIVAAFPASELSSKISFENEVACCTTRRDLDKIAVGYFDDDASYDAYRNGKVDEDFWKHAYKVRFGSSQAVPSGLISFENDGVEYLGKSVGPSVEYGSVEINPAEIPTTIELLKKQYGAKNVKVFLAHHSD